MPCFFGASYVTVIEVINALVSRKKAGFCCYCRCCFICSTTHNTELAATAAAAAAGISITFVVYSAVSVLGYMALGDDVPGELEMQCVVLLSVSRQVIAVGCRQHAGLRNVESLREPMSMVYC
jgi:hypothetical protein